MSDGYQLPTLDEYLLGKDFTGTLMINTGPGIIKQRGDFAKMIAEALSISAYLESELLRTVIEARETEPQVLAAAWTSAGVVAHQRKLLRRTMAAQPSALPLDAIALFLAVDDIIQELRHARNAFVHRVVGILLEDEDVILLMRPTDIAQSDAEHVQGWRELKAKVGPSVWPDAQIPSSHGFVPPTAMGALTRDRLERDLKRFHHVAEWLPSFRVALTPGHPEAPKARDELLAAPDLRRLHDHHIRTLSAPPRP